MASLRAVLAVLAACSGRVDGFVSWQEAASLGTLEAAPSGMAEYFDAASPEEAQGSWDVRRVRASVKWLERWAPPTKCAASVDPAQCPKSPYVGRIGKGKQMRLQRMLNAMVEEWGYDAASFGQTFAVHANRSVLDVGMGQAPVCVAAMMEGAKSYTGVDPALCLDKVACSRNQTEMPYTQFPFTGIKIMQAYQGEVNLLPATLESSVKAGKLKPGQYDVVTLRSVTEHLVDNPGVIKSIFDLLKPTQRLCLLHHNYYSYNGHHSVPHSPEQYRSQAGNEEYEELAQWRHLNEGTSQYDKDNLNRVRLGDLMALVDMHFNCSWRTDAIEHTQSELTEEVMAPFESRGFSRSELLVSHLYMSCVRREATTEASWTNLAAWRHPKTDGTYHPQELPEDLALQVGRQRTSAVRNVEGAPMDACW